MVGLGNECGTAGGVFGSEKKAGRGKGDLLEVSDDRCHW